MDDELECFRKAAELGCVDFLYLHNCFSYAGQWEPLPRIATPEEILDGTDRPLRINRYAAAVCAEWWMSKRMLESSIPTLASNYVECEVMAKRARAFGKKYGA